MPDPLRRSLVAAAAALAGIPAARAAQPLDELEFDQIWDVVIIGSGAAGLSAAVEARTLGASVLIVEKMGAVGGNSVISEGQMAVPNTPMQERLGIRDSADRFAEDILRRGSVARPELVRTLADSALDAYFWTQRELGVRWLRDRIESELGMSVPRIALVANLSGSGLIWPLFNRALALGAACRLRQQARSLILGPDGAVVGLVVDDKTDYRPLRIGARRGVIIASGGFGADIPMRRFQNPRLSDLVGTTTQPGCTSEMLRAAAKAGAHLLHMEYIHCLPDTSPLEKGVGLVWYFNRFCAAAQGVWVTRRTGERFVNELGTNIERVKGVLSVVSSGDEPVAVADSRAVAHPQSVIFNSIDVAELIARGVVRKFDSLEALASAMEIPLGPLQQEVAQWNRAVDGLAPDRFGRPVSSIAEPMGTPPWYAAPMHAKVMMTTGGIAIDSKARALRALDDRPIPGLYAAGEATGGVFGRAFLSSCGLLNAIVFGRIAGQEAARRL